MSTDRHTESEQSSQKQPQDGKADAKKSKPQKDEAQNWLNELQGALMTVAVLVASATYTAGLSPPGGLWQDDLDGHTAGTPILRDKSPKRYTTFFYANATAFMASLVIIILLTNENVHKDRPKTVVLLITMVLDLVSMMIAYAAGCARSVHTSIYVIALAAVALIVVFWWNFILPIIILLLPASWSKCIMGERCVDEFVKNPKPFVRVVKKVIDSGRWKPPANSSIDHPAVSRTADP